MSEEISAAIKRSAAKDRDSGLLLITLEQVRRLASQFAVPAREVEVAALEAGVVPLRYRRNIGTLGVEGQLKLLGSCVGVCGLGGLGGHVAALLARFGVGRLILADGDVFEEDNLNRQSFCGERDLGRPKAELAAERVAAINSSLDVTVHHRFLREEDMRVVFSGAALAIDALDTVSSRLALQRACAALGIPMVHGAIAGDCGQVMTVFPGDVGLEALYASGEDRGVEVVEGNPPTTPALVASVQAQEAVKIICGGELLRHGFLLMDTAANLYRFFPLK
jgi:molybdopterin/thiamine biosynthesis adenylyltransferase